MNKNTLYSLVLFLLGLGFLAGSYSDLQSLAYSAVCFLFLSFPLFSQIMGLVTTKPKPNTSTEENQLGVGA